MHSVTSDPILFGTYEQAVKVIVCDSLQEACIENRLPWSLDDDATTDAYEQYVKEYVYIVLKKGVTRQTVLHECVHAVDEMYAFMHASVDPKNDEIYARDVSWLQDRVLDFFEAHKDEVGGDE